MIFLRHRFDFNRLQGAASYQANLECLVDILLNATQHKVNMASSKDNKHEEDLSTLLSSEERVELTLLLANITELMRKQVEDTFDASETSSRQQSQVTEKNPNIDDSKAPEETEEEEKAGKLREVREKELSAPKILELKKDALDYFDKWRDSVILRVGKVVNNSKEVTKEQVRAASVEATPDAAIHAEPKVISEFENLYSEGQFSNIKSRSQYQYRGSGCSSDRAIPPHVNFSVLFATRQAKTAPEFHASPFTVPRALCCSLSDPPFTHIFFLTPSTSHPHRKRGENSARSSRSC